MFKLNFFSNKIKRSKSLYSNGVDFEPNRDEIVSFFWQSSIKGAMFEETNYSPFVFSLGPICGRNTRENQVLDLDRRKPILVV